MLADVTMATISCFRPFAGVFNLKQFLAEHKSLSLMQDRENPASECGSGSVRRTADAGRTRRNINGIAGAADPPAGHRTPGPPS